MGSSNVGTVIVIVVVAVLAAIIALICSSFSDLHYYQIGFVKSKTTGSVDTSKVWLSGRRWIGPDKTFKIFDSSAHYINLIDISVFAAADKNTNIPDESGSSGASLALVAEGTNSKSHSIAIKYDRRKYGDLMKIEVSVHIVYFLVAEDLKLLHDEYDINYEGLVRKSAQAAIKDTASLYKLSEFYKNREYVEQQLLAGVQERLGGSCCSINCEAGGEAIPCLPGCVPRDLCEDSQKGVFVEARYLQMTDLKIPSSIELRNLRTIIVEEETAQASFIQKAAVIEKETEQLVEVILNNATEVTANATAHSQLIAANSQANYQRILENARREGLYILFSSIGLTAVEHKNSFDYLRSLSDNSKAHLTVDFDQLIVGPTNLP